MKEIKKHFESSKPSKKKKKTVATQNTQRKTGGKDGRHQRSNDLRAAGQDIIMQKKKAFKVCIAT